MRVMKSFLTAGVALAVLIMPLVLAVPPAKAVGPDTDQLIRNGKVVAMTGMTITVQEWAGTYTYRLSPTGRQALDAARIKPGDQVRFTVISPWELAYDFRPMGHDPARPAMSLRSRRSGTMHSHLAVSPDTNKPVIGG